MSLGTTIEWTDATWNPVRGCTKISAGCKNCYAERFAERFRGVPGHPFEQGFEIRRVPEKLAEPLKWKEPRLVFVNSMSDLFHDQVPDEYIEQVAEVMVHAEWHTFQVLTKRGGRLESLLKTKLKKAAAKKHIWWGVSVENKRDGVPRIKHLQASPARMRFLSVEPLLEDVGHLNLKGISWVIVGGESGPRSRPIEASWVRSIKAQCEDAGVAFFFKQWGGVRKKTAGRSLDGETYSEFPLRTSNPILPEKQRRALIDRFRVGSDGNGLVSLSL
ncbi:MAG: phage Gp37/Gp68 family protein [Acidobacteriaceae bacterium]